MHRSGTSALARVLNLMGLYFGGEGASTGRNQENVKGFWERRDVRTLNDQILLAADADWDCVSQFDPERIAEDARARYASLAADITLDLDAHRPWFLKEPRLCVLLPIWRDALEMPVCVHVCRNPVAVARSLQARNGIPVAVGLALWELYNVRAIAASAGLPRVFAAYEDLMLRPVKAAARLRAELARHGGYPLRELAGRELTVALDRSLRHQRASKAALSAATSEQRRLYAVMTKATVDPAIVDTVPALSAGSLGVLQAYEASVDIAARRLAVESREQERTALHRTVQLAMKNLDLTHAKGRIADWQERAATAERRLGETRRTLERARRSEGELRVRLASTEQKVVMREREADAATRETWALRRSHAERLEVEREAVRAATAQRHRAARAADARRRAILSLTPSWDAALARTKAAHAELRGIAEELETGIGALLSSKRWRIGSAIVVLGRALLLRRRQQGPADAWRISISLQDAQQRFSAEISDALAGLAADAMRFVPNQADAVCAHLGSSDRRDAELFDTFLARRLGLATRRTEVLALRRYVGSLVAIGESLIASKRWRLGDRLLGLPHRLALRKAPQTGADSMAAAIAAARCGSDDLTDIAALFRPPSEPLPAGTVPAKTTDRTPPAEDQAETKQGPIFPTSDYSAAAVDVVVCVHNALDHVERCLASVVAKSTVPYRLIVVNDGSSAQTTARLRALADETEQMELVETADGPLGYTRAANCGLRASTADFVVLLNSDTVVPRLWLEGLLDAMASGDDVGAVGPLSNAASWQSVPERVSAEGDWMVNALPLGYGVDEYAELIHTLAPRNFPRVPLINGFCMMLRRSVLNRVGLLDEESFPKGYGEENDYCLRLRQAGFSIAIADHCYVYHAKSQSFGDERPELAQQGGRALEKKHGAKAIAEATATMKANVSLRVIRKALLAYQSLASALDADGFANAHCQHWAARSHGVLFVLPVKGGSGGANSVVQEVVGMRALGVDARIAAHRRYADSLRRFYPATVAAGTFVFYDSDDGLLRCALPFDVIVATLWSTPALIAPMASRHPEKAYVYYVQDYEPWFFPEDSESRTVALDSYTVIPGMTLMAKTDWICRTVASRHGSRVYRVAPSLDHDVYYPDPDDALKEAVTVVAMIRPSTPRRAPIRTLRTMRALAGSTTVRTRFVVFGCEQAELDGFLKVNAPDLRDFEFENRGVLAREGVADLLREADVFVDLSDYQAFGRTGLEAMACGCAVILPACGGVDEYATDGVNAVLVDPTDAERVVEWLTALIGDAGRRRAMRARAIETAARYSVARASLSELSVFRLAWRMRVEETEAASSDLAEANAAG